MNWKFWEKKDSFGLPNDLLSTPDPLASSDLGLDKNDLGLPPAPDFSAPDLSTPSTPPPSFNPAPAPSFNQPPPGFDPTPPNAFSQNQPPPSPQANVQNELVLARLDAIKNQLELLNQRMVTLEQANNQKEKQQSSVRKSPWYT